MNRNTYYTAISISSPLLLLLAWQAGASTGLIDTRFFSSPVSIGAELMSMVRSGELLDNTAATLGRLFVGFFTGAIPAIVLGVAMGLSRPLRAAIDPLIAATYPLPKSAIFPLLLMIFGLGEPSKIAMVALGVFYPVLINSMAGVLSIQRIYFDVGKNFGATGSRLFWTVALPGALPSIFTGIKLGFGMGLILIAIAEMIGAQRGLGYLIWDAWQTLSVDRMFVGLVVIAILGFVLSTLLDWIETKALPWYQGR